ncbi:MAG: cupin domain-containing protein [Pseudomonadales bacterium]
MDYQPINLREKLGRFDDHWAPRVIAEMNDYQFKLVKVLGEFVWHRHAATDETFLVIEGELHIDFRDGSVTLSAGELFVVPRGEEHRPWAAGETQVLILEPRGVVNTGDAATGPTAENDIWV